MATLIQPKEEKQIRNMSVKNVRDEYIRLNHYYSKMVDGDFLLCPKCNEWLSNDSFYLDKSYATHKFPVCKKCLVKMVEQRKKDTDPPNETKESVQEVLRFMNKVYDDNYYESCIQSVQSKLGEHTWVSVFAFYMTGIQSLPQFRGKTWKDSVFGNEYLGESAEEINENSQLVKRAKKRFGKEYSTLDLWFLETQYEDWTSRYECNTKAQEEIFERLAWKKLEIKNATKAGQSTEKLDRTYQDLLSTANITPKQTGMDAFADAQTLGTLIQKWEEEDPIPEVDPELKDVDKIGLYIDAFYRGHTSKMLGIKNAFSNLYDKVMSKYTVKPPEYEEDDDSEDMFNKIFGSVEDF